ncbi:hypothetical protein ACH5RR_031223 [Cinchona calisaya]|uniref:F-box protein n=1 Tax=Cinchona calisaya TaxID=153742 RepID=A0ABD2YGK5_9GENT
MRISISGICYNSLIDDYKVVMGLKYRCHHLTPGFCNCPRGVVLVSELKDKRWKEIDGFSNYSVYGKRIGVLFNGFLHWTVVDAEMAHEFWPPNKIIGFDPKTDEVNEIPLPISKNKEEICILGLGVLEGSLCMTCWDPEFCCKGNIEVFVMKEYGIQESWIPLFDIWGLDINPHSTPLIPLFLTKNGVVVLVMGDWKTSVFGIILKARSTSIWKTK